MGSHTTVHNKNIHEKGREQQKILHKGTNNDKVNALITLLYPLNKIKFNTGKTRNSSNDFMNHPKKYQNTCAKKKC